MSADSTGTASKTREPIPGGSRLHPPVVRIMHWTNAAAMLVMITSGWGIYNDDVVIDGLHFAQWMRLGAWGNESLLWHFAGMWLLAINGLCYLAYGLITGRLRERLLPIRIRDVVATVRDTLRLRIAHDDLTTYNAVQKLLYVVVILAGVSQVVTGLCLWQPVQFQSLVGVLGGFQAVRIEHFTGMSMICGFIVVHVALSILVPSTLWAMIAGGPRLARRGART